MPKMPVVYTNSQDVFRKYIDELPITHFKKKYIKGVEVVLEDYSSFVLGGDMLYSDLDIDKNFVFGYWPKGKPKPIGIKVLIDTELLEHDVKDFMKTLFEK